MGRWPAHAFHTGKAELIVCLLFFVIRENFVSFGSFLKLFFRGLVARIFVGMILNGKLAISFFYLVL